ncbi:hypothetical protein [Actinoplanes regularis]|uniref:hypothetical protein n=1 Tax=Actinoplanes regularis TaxID=52697 RepID=UPI000B76EAEE|nr:hypothetical protein [Actinoplanes regularis]
MSSSPSASLGLIGNALVGYQLARTHRRQLLAVLLPVLAVALLVLFLLDVSLGRDQTVIINGAPVVHGDERLSVVRTALVVVFWLVGLVAAVLVATGAARGHAVRPGAAIWAAVKRLPVFAVALCAVAAGTILVLRMVVGLATGMPGLIMVFGVFAVAAVLAARLLIGLLARQFGGFVWAVTTGRVAGTAGAFVLGGLVVPAGLAWMFDAPLGNGLLHPVVTRVIGAVLVTALVAAQAGVLTHTYLLRRDELGEWGQTAVDPSAVDAGLAELSGDPVRRPWAAAAATVLALLTPAAVAAVNPFRAPTVRSNGDAPGGAVAVVWPTGKHPVIAATFGARFCDDDACERYVSQDHGPGVMDDYGAAAISADGTAVVKAVLTGGLDNGGPFVDFARCTRDGCQEAWVPVRASAKETFGWPELAVAVAPDQSIWFGLALASENEKPGEANFAITLIRCPDAPCAKPERHRAGTVERLPGDAVTGPRSSLSIGSDGRPILAVRTGLTANLVTCDPVTCANPRASSTFTGQGDTRWAAPTSLTGPAVTFAPGQLRIGERTLPLESGEIFPTSAAVTAAGAQVYVTAAEATPPPGPHVTISTSAGPAEPEYWQQVLWRCDQERCSRQTLDYRDTVSGRDVLAVADDGRVLIVGDDRILLVSAPRP